MNEGSGASMGTSQSDLCGRSMSRCPELYMELYNASTGLVSVDMNCSLADSRRGDRSRSACDGAKNLLNRSVDHGWGGLT
eukprot:15460319-Alexandrium_andersonii.AAC.2